MAGGKTTLSGPEDQGAQIPLSTDLVTELRKYVLKKSNCLKTADLLPANIPFRVHLLRFLIATLLRL